MTDRTTASRPVTIGRAGASCGDELGRSKRAVCRGGELVAHSLLEGPEEALATIDPVCLEIGGGRPARPPPHYPCAVLTQGLSLFQQMLFLSFVALQCWRHFPYIE
jgi:hypothetical protein